MAAAWPEPDRSAEHSGTPGPAPGAGSPKARTWIGCTAASAGSMISSRESTAPAASCARASAEAWIRLLASSWAPAAFRAATSWRSAVRYAAGPVLRDDLHAHLTRTRAEAGDDRRRVHAVHAAAELAPDRGRDHDHLGAQRARGVGPQHQQIRGGHPLSLERRAHQRITGHDRAAGDLLRDPDGGELGRSAEGLAPGRARGRRAVAGGPGVRPGQKTRPRRRRPARSRPRPPG